MAMYVFDTSADSLIVDNFAISNFAAGDPVTYAKNNDNIKVDQDAFGDPFAVVSHKGAGKMNVKLLPGTPSFRKLMELANKNVVFGVTLTMQGERISGTNCMISRTPNGSISENSPVRDFTINMLDYKHETIDA